MGTMKRLFMNFLNIFEVSCFVRASNNVEAPCRFANCTGDEQRAVCGLRHAVGGVRVRLFENECEMQKYGCQVPESEAYIKVNMEYCDRIFDSRNQPESPETISLAFDARPAALSCTEINCSTENSTSICALRRDGGGYRVRLFESRCDMRKHNCGEETHFNETDSFLCQDLEITGADEISENLIIEQSVKPKLERVIVVNAGLNFRRDLNASVDEFFAATHSSPLFLDEVPPETRRNMVLKTASPVVIFKPWVRVPKNKSEDHWHKPTLASCYHKCPVKCPETYTPVCGVPGVAAREPSLIFRNHCFMDKAQCKMFWENKSPTAESSNYVEGSFIFCLGDELTSLYRFLPLIKSLQRMGRLKQRGKFRYKLRNLRYLNNIVVRNPRIMG